MVAAAVKIDNMTEDEVVVPEGHKVVVYSYENG